MTLSSFKRLLSLAVLSTALLPALAQGDRPAGGQFRFVHSGVPTSLKTCEQVDIVVENAASSGVGPFYMISSPVGGGTPQTNLIGSSAGSLRWTVSHPAGSKLVLNVVDSTGSGGGIPATVFDVVAGDSTSCVVRNANAPEFVAWTNVTRDLQTCAGLGIAFDGGQGPYQISISSLDAPTVTNITIGTEFSQYTYVNRAPGGSQMAITVSDSTGRWAQGVPLINTVGGSDTDCPGSESSTGDWQALGYTKPTYADEPEPEPESSAPASSSASSTSSTASSSSRASMSLTSALSSSATSASARASSSSTGDDSSEDDDADESDDSDADNNEGGGDEDGGAHRNAAAYVMAVSVPLALSAMLL